MVSLPFFYQDFTIGRRGYGKIQWLGETDIRGLDLDSIVTIDQKEVNVYDTGILYPLLSSPLPITLTCLNLS